MVSEITPRSWAIQSGWAERLPDCPKRSEALRNDVFSIRIHQAYFVPLLRFLEANALIRLRREDPQLGSRDEREGKSTGFYGSLPSLRDVSSVYHPLDLWYNYKLLLLLQYLTYLTSYHTESEGSGSRGGSGGGKNEETGSREKKNGTARVEFRFFSHHLTISMDFHIPSLPFLPESA